MRLYLDDNLASPLVARLFRKAGHDVQMPADVGTNGEDDPVHLTHAIQDQRICLSQNYGDFAKLHNLVILSGGHHPGIIVVRRDNDPTRDLTPQGIVRAFRNLVAANVPIANQHIILNHWR